MAKKKWKIEEFINAVIDHRPDYISSQMLADAVGCDLEVAQNKISDLRMKGYLKHKPTSKRKGLRQQYALAPFHKLYEITLRLPYKRGRTASGYPKDDKVKDALRKALSAYHKKRITLPEMVEISGFSRSYVGCATRPLIEEGILSKIYGGSAGRLAVYEILEKATPAEAPVQEPLLTDPAPMGKPEFWSRIRELEEEVQRLEAGQRQMSDEEAGYYLFKHIEGLHKSFKKSLEECAILKEAIRKMSEKYNGLVTKGVGSKKEVSRLVGENQDLKLRNENLLAHVKECEEDRDKLKGQFQAWRDEERTEVARLKKSVGEREREITTLRQEIDKAKGKKKKWFSLDSPGGE
ncbi:MAG: hypothetical protein DRH97_02945 [Chloroflexi bacterium]|nr:MAG: hypothetical protein DRH97_02945 [Chloroflexota bacterium]